MTPAVAYTLFELRRMGRNRGILLTSVVTPGLLYFMNVNSPNAALFGLDWKLYFLGSMTAYAAITAAVVVGPSVAGERASGWTQQLRLTPLAPTSYITAKVTTALVVALGPAAVIAAEGLLIAKAPPATLLRLTMVVAVGSLPFAALGLLIGYTVPARGVPALMPPVIITLSVLGGLFWPTIAMPAWLRHVAEQLPSHHLAQVTRSVLAQQRLPLTSLVVLAFYTAAMLILIATRYRRDEAGASAVR